MRRAHEQHQTKRPLVIFGPLDEFNTAIDPALGFELAQRDGLAVITEVMRVEWPVIAFVGGPIFKSLPPRSRRHESRQALPSVEMPFADKPCPVPRCPERLGNRLLGLAESEIVGDHAVAMAIR